MTVHGRTIKQKGTLTGMADWDIIKTVREELSIPVFANGNILYGEDADACIAQTGVAGVMTAEGNLADPTMFETGKPHKVTEVRLVCARTPPPPPPLPLPTTTH